MMISKVRAGMCAVVAGAALSLAAMASPASAQGLLFDFDSDATGDCTNDVGGSDPCFDGDRLDLTITSYVDQTVTGILNGVGDTFTEEGAGFISSARKTGELGLKGDFGSLYNAYVYFEASGTVAPSAGGATATMTSLKFEAWLDPDNDTTITESGTPGAAVDDDGQTGLRTGAGRTTFADNAATPTFTFANTDDDFIIATNTIDGLVLGEVVITVGFTEGNFRALFETDMDITGSTSSAGDGDTDNDVVTFPTVPGFPQEVLTDLTGDISSLTFAGQDPTMSFTDARFEGSIIRFQRIPEPTTLALFGTGLLGLGALMRRRRRAA